MRDIPLEVSIKSAYQLKLCVGANLMLADIKQLLQQAQVAQEIGNWTVVIQCLQQLVLGE